MDHSIGESSRNVARAGDSFSTAAADYYVPSLPGLGNLASHPTHPLTVHAGTLPSYPGPPAGGDGKDATGRDAQIFFMMIKARRSAGRERVIFWFNGGPGCSSFDGALMEVGPFRTVNLGENGGVELRLVESGWEEYATIIFVDQPPGTGLSTVPTNGYLHELSQASAHLIQFMQNFYQVFPEMRLVDTYLAGESFAGQYIPYFADAILSSSAFNDFPLRGIAIGNGWIDPREQYQGYVDFGYAKGLIKEGSKEADFVEEQMQRCRSDTDQWEDGSDMPINMNACFGVMDSVTRPFTQDLNGKTVCMNVYDTRLVDDWPACGMNWPPDLPDVYLYMRRPEVVRALHATAKETAWVECDNNVSNELYLHNTPAAVNLIPGILERGVEVMLFAGDEDLICNYVGIERTIERMKWSGGQGLMNATSEEWYVNGTYAGAWRTGRNLTYVRVAGASHMVGYDVPIASNDMMLRFMGVDMEAVAGDSATIPSRLGDTDRVQLGYVGDSAVPARPSSGAKGHNWEAWFNAGSSLILMLLIGLAAGFYLYLRSKRRDRLARIALDSNSRPRDEEERVPLGAESFELDAPANGYHDNGNGHHKGKERSRHGDYDEVDDEGQVVFELGDDDEDHAKGR